MANATTRAMRRNSSAVTGPPVGISEASTDCINCCQSSRILALRKIKLTTKHKDNHSLPELFHSQARKSFPVNGPVEFARRTLVYSSHMCSFRVGTVGTATGSAGTSVGRFLFLLCTRGITMSGSFNEGAKLPKRTYTT
jgi:hypothetical protein